MKWKSFLVPNAFGTKKFKTESTPDQYRDAEYWTPKTFKKFIMPTFDFITKNDENAIVEAIGQAEQNTSGEIRVHIEKHTELTPIERAKEVFYELGMDATELRNGVLFYVGVDDHSFAIIGDEGIDKVVPNDFWESTKDIVIDHFKKKEFREGLIAGVLRAGEQLKRYFPSTNNNPNELSNEITRG